MAVVVAIWMLLRGGLPFDVGFGGLSTAVMPTRQPEPAVRGAAEQAPRDRLTLVTGSGRHDINLEIADTDQKRMVGLMFRTSMPFGHGMLFPYPAEHEITMWMKNTYISLDMVFIRPDGTVHRVARNTEPMSEEIISSRGPVSAVLELIAGSADRYRIEPGSRVEHPLFKPGG